VSWPSEAGRRAADPFAQLGLPASAALTDDDVRSAWRRIAVTTHPDRADGGDPDRFAAASAAYTLLRTRAGRGEALADLAAEPTPGRAAPVARDFAPGTATDAALGVAAPGVAAAPPDGLATNVVSRVVHGRPAVLTVRLLIVAAVGTGSASLVGFAPATPALITGALTWLVLTARHDLAPRA
jgi:hypothetical protein